MTPEEIISFNKKCAEFVYPNLVDIDDTGIWGLNKDKSKEKLLIFKEHSRNILQEEDLKFHSDYNWTMLVKHKICKLDCIDEFNCLFDSVAKGWRCAILPAYKNTFDYIYSQVFETEIEAHIAVINKFLDWYLNNKI